MPKKKRGVPLKQMNLYCNKPRPYHNMLRKICLAILRKRRFRWAGQIMTLKNCPVLFKLFIEGSINSKQFLQFLFMDDFPYNNFRYMDQNYKQNKLNKYLKDVSTHRIDEITFFSEGNQQLKMEKQFMSDFLSFIFPILPLALMITFFGNQNIDKKHQNQAVELLKSLNDDQVQKIKDLIRNPSNFKLQQLIQKRVNKMDPNKFDYATRDRNNRESNNNFSQFFSMDIDYPAEYQSIQRKEKQINNLYTSFEYDSKFQEELQDHTRITQSGAFTTMHNDNRILCLIHFVQFLKDIKSNKPLQKVEKNGVMQKVYTRHKPSGIQNYKRQNIPNNSFSERIQPDPARMMEDFIQQPMSERSEINSANSLFRQKQYYPDQFYSFEAENPFGQKWIRESKMQEDINQLEEQLKSCGSDFKNCDSQKPQVNNRMTRSKAKIMPNVSNNDHGRFFKVQQESRRDQVRLSIPAQIFSMKPASSTQPKRSSIVSNSIQLLRDSSNLLKKNQHCQKLAHSNEQKRTKQVKLFLNENSQISNNKQIKNSFISNFDIIDLQDELMSFQYHL